MHKARVEAFSDGVIAIIITIMVLEMRVPHGAELASLKPLAPTFVSYVLSFIYIGIYWSNHHHLFQATAKVNGMVLWANLHLLFWLSLIPFTTHWIGEHQFAQVPVMLYGINLLAAAIAYYILVRALLSLHGTKSTLAQALGADFKGKISIVIYLLALLLSFWNSYAAYSLYIFVAAIWFVPDKRIENIVN